MSVNYNAEFEKLTANLPELRIDYLRRCYPELDTLGRFIDDYDIGGLSISNLSEFAGLLTSLAGLVNQYITRAICPTQSDPIAFSSEVIVFVTSMFEAAWELEAVMVGLLNEGQCSAEEAEEEF